MCEQFKCIPSLSESTQRKGTTVAYSAARPFKENEHRGNAPSRNMQSGCIPRALAAKAKRTPFVVKTKAQRTPNVTSGGVTVAHCLSEKEQDETKSPARPSHSGCLQIQKLTHGRERDAQEGYSCPQGAAAKRKARPTHSGDLNKQGSSMAENFLLLRTAIHPIREDLRSIHETNRSADCELQTSILVLSHAAI